MKKQTAVEWMIQEFELKYPFLMEDGMINQAKAMERDQIIDACNYGDFEELAEQYYNETYGK
jgi:dihydroneopterin aldolase